MYFITTFQRLQKDDKGWLDFGDERTVGFYSNLKNAQESVISNAGDMCETIYEYAVIQKLEEGLYPTVEYQELYKIKDIVDERGFYNFNLTYEQIEIPEWFPLYGLDIG